MKKVLFLWLFILLAKESTAALSDFLYLASSTQTIGTVTSISDGDTIKVDLLGTTTTVRLLSIDTPELPDEPFAQSSKDFTSLELLNQPVKLFYSNNPEQQKDTYGRLLAVVVKNDDEIFNLKLLEQGLAVRMFIFNDIIKFPDWEDVEINARQMKRNIWSKINSNAVFINEINPNPNPEPDNEAEFVELYNNSSTPVNVGSWTLISIYYEAVIPEGTTIPGYGYLIIARTNTTRFKQIYPDTPANIIDVRDNLRLQNTYTPKEDLLLHLRGNDKSYQDSLTYNLDWDNGDADGTGKTLERKSLLTNVGDSEVGGIDDDNWDASSGAKGSPGTTNSVGSKGLDVSSWIISCQRTTGAICTDQSQTKIIPYKANIAAMGLLEEGGYETYVKAWIEWFFTHLDAVGTIYDYEVISDSEISAGTAEAEDRNLATFFTLLKKYYQATFDIDYLKDYQTQLDYMANWVIFFLQDYIDYLTWTNSLWQQKLLINNAESYQGLKDLARVYYDLFDDNSQRDFYDSGAISIREAIANELWYEAENWYYWRKDDSGNKTDCNWATLYPDAISQLYTFLNNVNLPESLRSSTLYDTFNTYQPAWTGTTSYCEMGYAGGLMADTTKTQTYQNTIINNVINQGYPPPWDSQEAGFYLLMEDRFDELGIIQPLLNQPEELCLNFIASQMLTPFGGIQAQFDNNALISNTAGVNHEVTSEATGQALLYAVLTGNKTLFDEQLEILKNNLLCLEHNVLVWKLKPNGEWWTNNGHYANASKDDLRAIWALLLAYDTFGDENYLNEAKSLAQGLKEHNTQGGELKASFNWEPGWTSQEVFLSYIDLATMKKLAEFDSDWESIIQTNKKIIIDGTATSGLYYYLYNNGYYYGENYGQTIPMIHAGWIAENLARYWKLTTDQDCRASAEKFLNFAKNEYQTYGKIFGEYNIAQGTHTVEYEDTSIYSIIARLAFILGDFAFAKTLLNNKILPQQNKNIRSKTVGCFGYDFENPYAFVCLEALLAMVELEGKEDYLIRGKCSSSNGSPLEGVQVTLSGDELMATMTDSNGNYKFTGQPDGNYAISPYKEGYWFEPRTVTISSLNKHWDNVNFTALSGKITSVSPISGTVGTLIAISGEGFSPCEDIQISFGSVITVVITSANAFGEFSVIFTVPLQPSGTTTISAWGCSSALIGISYFFLRGLDHFTIATISSQVAGAGFEISLYAEDARNDIFEYTGTASLSDASMTILPIETTLFTSGIWTGTVTITKSGTTTITVEAENKVGTSNPFLVNSASINKLLFLTPIRTIIVGSSSEIIIFQTQDEFGNPANTQGDVEIQLLGGKFSLTQSPWIDTNTVTLTSGTNTGWFYYSNILAGTQTITIKEEPTQGWFAGTQCVIVNPASLDHFDFKTITTQQAGEEFQIEMMAKDAFENITDWTGTVNLTVNPGVATFTAGKSIATVTITKAGTTTIIAFNNKSGTSNVFFVNPAQLDHFIFGTISSQVAGEEFTIKIMALDIYGNMATYSETADLDTGTITTITFIQGSWEGSVTITKAGTTTITVSSAGKQGTSSPFWVAPNTLDHFIFENILSQQAGIEFGIKITALDAFENATDYSGIAYLQDISQTIFPATTTFINGIWDGTVTITKSGTTAIIVSIDNKCGTSNNFWLEPGPLHYFSFATITDRVAGKEFGITITAKDIYGNIANYSDKAKLQDASDTLTGTLTNDFKNGIWNGTVAITRAGTTCIFASTNGNTGTSNTFYVSPDVLNKIMINPALLELGVGDEYRFEASGYDIYDNELEGLAYTWNTMIGSVNPTIGTSTLFKATTTLLTGTLTATCGTITGYATITLQIGTLSYITIIPPRTTITVGNSFVFTAKGYDNYGNEKSIEDGRWEVGSGSIIPVMGSVTLFTAGTKTELTWIKYQVNQIIGSATISIVAGSLTCFKIGTILSPQTAGIPFEIIITAQDAYGNTVEDYTGVALLSYSAGKIYPDRTTNHLAGLWTGTITVENAADNAMITVQDNTIKGTSNTFTVIAGSLDYFEIGEIGLIYLINTEIPIVVTAKDTYGNTVTDYNGTFSLTDDTETIYPKLATCTAGRYSGSVSISQAKTNIKITATAQDKKGISNPFAVLINNEVTYKDTLIEIPLGSLPTDFYVTIDPDPDDHNLEINLANVALSLDKTTKGIGSSLRLFEAYDKDDNPLQVGTNSFVLITLPYPDENKDGLVDYSDVVIKEETLKIYELKNNRWKEVKDCLIHRFKNTVSASVPSFGVYMLVGNIIPANFDTVVVYPNPFKPIRGDNQIIFDGLCENTTIRIYDISGSLIREIEDITTGTYEWDVKNNYGENVDSGVYIYIVSNDKGLKKTGKIAIIR